MEEELFSKPITEEEAEEGMAKNESSIVSRFYKMFGRKEQEEEMDEDEEEMEGEEDEEEMDELNTNVEEYIDESIQESSVMPRNMDRSNYAETEEANEESEEKPRTKKRRDSKVRCASGMIPKFSHKSKGKVKSENMNIYKPKSSRLRHLQKIDNSVPKSVKKVFEEQIVDFKNNNKLSKSEKSRIQGCFVNDTNQTSKFSSFQAESESPYDMDINANDVNFENYSLI